MTKKKQAPFADGYIEETFEIGSHVCTIQVRQTTEGFNATWWISGPGHHKLVRLLLELQMQVGGQIIEEAMSIAKGMTATKVLPLAELSGMAGGLRSLAPENTNEVRTQLLESHIELHKKTEALFVSGEPQAETVQVYFLAKGFGIKNPVNFVASRLDVPISTITRRLAKARNSGLVPKLNTTFQVKEELIEGYEY